jgi:transposase
VIRCGVASALEDTISKPRKSRQKALLLVEGGLLTERLVTPVQVTKYADHTRLYRQGQIIARQGIAVDRSVLAF